MILSITVTVQRELEYSADNLIYLRCPYEYDERNDLIVYNFFFIDIFDDFPNN